MAGEVVVAAAAVHHLEGEAGLGNLGLEAEAAEEEGEEGEEGEHQR